MTRIDLHTHSLASDGTQTPAELVRAAADAGLDVVAITDQDTTAGWAEANKAADAPLPSIATPRSAANPKGNRSSTTMDETS